VIGLHADVSVHRNEFRLDVELTVQPREVVAVLGPNGSGKSTLLGVLAGLLRPDGGTVALDGSVLTDAADGRLVPARRRRMGLLAQQPLLFPHLTVRENVAFGPLARGVRRRDARACADRQLDEVGARPLADRRPGRLSGGQAARVALARALASDPEVLLLDEPLAAVDVETAPALRALLRRLLADRMGVVVTHNPLDALVLADRVLVLADGRIVEQGSVRQVLAAPRSAFAARLAGLNLLAGTATATGLRTLDGLDVRGHGESATPGEPAVAVFSPAAVAVHTGAPHGSPRNAFADRVAALEPQGDLVRVRSDSGLAADVTAASVAELGLHAGGKVWLVVKATEVAVHPSGRSAASTRSP
jgi:molybdate transport system ATP-binding protein